MPQLFAIQIVEKLGAYAGIVAFLGLALLAMLYFSQARDVRRLREWAGRAPERAAKAAEPYKPEQAAEQPPKRSEFRMPYRWKYVTAVVAALLLVAGGTTLAVTQFVGGDSKGERKSGNRNKKERSNKVSSVQPSQITVAVLNGTSTPGLANTVGSSLRAAGFKLGSVTNASRADYTSTVVMYASGNKAEARAVARQLKTGKTEQLDAANSSLSGGAKVVVVVGSDKAGQAPAQEPQQAPATQAPPATGQPAPTGGTAVQ